MLASGDDILKFIPQRFPMVMIHKLVEATENFAHTRLSIEPDNIFIEAGKLSEAGLLENIAQTGAAQIGYMSYIKGNAVPLGFIAAVKNFEIVALPGIGVIIDTSVQITSRVMDFFIIAGESKAEGEVLCKCEMKVFVKDI